VLDRIVAPGVLIGVDQGLQVVASVPNALTVEVSPGGAFLQGGYVENPTGTGNVVLPVPPNASGGTRFDRVVLAEDFTAQSITLQYRAGTGSVYVPVRTSSLWELSLAQVAVPNSAVSVTPGEITDERLNPAVGGAALVRPQAPSRNPALPLDLSAQAGIVHHLRTPSSLTTYTVPAGKQWLLVRLWSNAAGPTVNVDGKPFQTLGAAGTVVALPWPLLLDTAHTLTLPAGAAAELWEVTQDPTRTGITISAAATALYTVPAGQRLVIQAANCAAGAWVADSVSSIGGTGAAAYYVLAPSGLGVSGAPAILPFPVIVAGGRALVQNIANAVTLFGYLEPSGDTLPD
jgi:hypothetical protein